MQRAGKQDTKITVSRVNIQENAMGGRSNAAAEKILDAWASVNYGTGNERRVAGQEASAITATFRIYSTEKSRSVTSKDQLTISGQHGVWDIISAVPYGINKSIDITAKRIK